MTAVASNPVELRPDGLAAADVVDVARRDRTVVLGQAARARIEASAAVVERLAAGDVPVYGVSTGFGSLANTSIPADRRVDLQQAIVRSHAAGMGAAVEREVVRAMMLLRARTLAMGYSGVRPEVVESMVALLNAGVTPVVREYGSLGASGDLAPLATCALVLLGEGEAETAGGTVVSGAEALAARRVGAAHAHCQGGPGRRQRHRRHARHAVVGARRPRPPVGCGGRGRGDDGRGAAGDRPRLRRRPAATASTSGSGP